MWSQETVRKLLEAGANIGMKNHFDEVPISKILPDTMEDFLDEFCLEATRDVHHEDFEITFNYSFLAPPRYGAIQTTGPGISGASPEIFFCIFNRVTYILNSSSLAI